MDFKKMREQKKWTQTEAAKACRVAVVTWRLWESGGGKPNPENMNNIREAFGILPFADQEG